MEDSGMFPDGLLAVAQQVTNLTSIHEDAGSIPGLTRFTDPALLQPVAQAADMARILHCYGCGVGLQLQLRFNLYLGNFHMHQVQPLKKKKCFLGQRREKEPKPEPSNEEDRKHRALISIAFTKKFLVWPSQRNFLEYK